MSERENRTEKGKPRNAVTRCGAVATEAEGLEPPDHRAAYAIGPLPVALPFAHQPVHAVPAGTQTLLVSLRLVPPQMP
jgi:hypothetical protein